jgi:hypothetical protein
MHYAPIARGSLLRRWMAGDAASSWQISHAAQEAAIAGYIRWANRRATPMRRFAVDSKIRRPDYLPNVA